MIVIFTTIQKNLALPPGAAEYTDWISAAG